MLNKTLLLKIIKIIVIILIIAGVGIGGYFIYKKITSSKNSNTMVSAMPVNVARGDIEVKLSGTGTVEPFERYDITPLVKGNIISSPFEEGTQVKTGDLLYQIDNSDLSINIEKAQNKIEELKTNHKLTIDNIKKLQVFAPCEGIITDFSLRADEQVGSNSKIATIINNSQVSATIAFTKSQVEQIYIGQKAQLIVPQYMSYIDGEVTYINNASRIGSDGTVLYNVKITINNPGAIAEGTLVNGLVKGINGDIVSPVSGTIENLEKKSVIANTTGIVKEVYAREGEWINKGDKILELENDTLVNSINNYDIQMRELQLSLDAQLKQIQDYNIISPIDGTIITKNYKAGEAVNNATSNVVLMTVADMSRMKFSLGVDELDIAKVQVGQKVNITADALQDMNFEGEISNIPAEGETQNGVTTYLVEVIISDPGTLKSGMNVNAEIIVESKKDVLYLPMGAVTKIRDMSFVMVNNEKEEDVESGRGERNDQGGRGGQAEQGASVDEQGEQGIRTYKRRTQENIEGNREQRSGGTSNIPVSMDELERKEIELGINNDEFIEIVSGLAEGETVFYTIVSSAGQPNNSTGMPNIQRGGMPGGGMPSGGFPSGGVRMPSGGMIRMR